MGGGQKGGTGKTGETNGHELRLQRWLEGVAVVEFDLVLPVEAGDSGLRGEGFISLNLFIYWF